jgi:hypothetical protein
VLNALASKSQALQVGKFGVTDRVALASETPWYFIDLY